MIIQVKGNLFLQTVLTFKKLKALYINSVQADKDTLS